MINGPSLPNWYQALWDSRQVNGTTRYAGQLPAPAKNDSAFVQDIFLPLEKQYVYNFWYNRFWFQIQEKGGGVEDGCDCDVYNRRTIWYILKIDTFQKVILNLMGFPFWHLQQETLLVTSPGPSTHLPPTHPGHEETRYIIMVLCPAKVHLVHHGISWYKMVHHNKLWYITEHHGTSPWCCVPPRRRRPSQSKRPAGLLPRSSQTSTSGIESLFP